MDHDTRFSDPGRLCMDDIKEARLGFAIRTTLVRKLESVPIGVNDRVVIVRIPLQ